MGKKSKAIGTIAIISALVGGIAFTVGTTDVFAKSDKKVEIKESFDNLEVETNNASIELVPTKADVATIEYSNKKKTRFSLKADVHGDTLQVELKEKRKFFWFGFSSSKSTLTVSLPEKQFNHLQAESDNGRITAEEIKADRIELESANGEISLKDIKADSVDVETDNGKVVLEDVEGNIKGSTDNGKISMATKELDQQVMLVTDNGSIEIKTDSEPSNATIDAKTDNGKIHIFGNEDSFVKYGKGKHQIKLRTDNGPITVTR